MKQKLLLAFVLLLSIGTSAQTILNGGFEYWNSSTIDQLNFYPNTSNLTAHQRGLPANALKVADPQQGALAIQLNTVANATDTMFGYFLNGDPNTMAGGIPYNQHPVSMTGYYKCHIMPNDTGFVIVIFKQGGVVVSTDFKIFTGNQTTYAPFTITLSIPALANPDTVIIGGVSSNAFSTNGIAGSMLQLDNFVFTGVPSQPSMMNGSFEAWTGYNSSTPLNWKNIGDISCQSTDAHGGNYALQLNTVQYDPSSYGASFATNGDFTNSGPVGGRPFSLMDDTLCGWYKYIPSGMDSGFVGVQTTQMTTIVGGAILPLQPASSYTFFSLPFSSWSAPDSLQIAFGSSINDIHANNVGSILRVDDLYLKSSLTGIKEMNWNAFGLVQLYPNPSNGDAWMEWSNSSASPVVMNITDETGRLISSTEFSGIGHQREHIDTSLLAKGVYVVTLVQNGNHTSRKLFVQ